jgi:very-short-patch-repair endonuclease
MTKEERRLWYDFLRYCTPRFRRQEIVSNYILDFFCHSAKLAIELDGSQHFASDGMKYDWERTCHLRSLGITLVRFPNSDIHRNFQGVCQKILLLLEERGFHPSVAYGDSSPQGEP